MKFYFFWDGEGCDREPGCKSDILSDGGIDILACLLTDSGGQKFQDSIPWLSEGLSRVEAIKSGEMKASGWNRDSWGVEIKGESAKIYSLYDEGFFSVIPVSELGRALASWRDFLLSG